MSPKVEGFSAPRGGAWAGVGGAGGGPFLRGIRRPTGPGPEALGVLQGGPRETLCPGHWKTRLLDHSWERILLKFLFQKLRNCTFVLSFGLAMSAFFSELRTFIFSSLVHINLNAFHMWGLSKKAS